MGILLPEFTRGKEAEMWDTTTLWFDVFIFTGFMLLGHILFGHFEERTPRWRKLVKALGIIVIFTSLSALWGRWISFSILGISLIPVAIIHGVLLPRKGINGWTGEPKALYYEFRGWDKDIFKTKEDARA